MADSRFIFNIMLLFVQRFLTIITRKTPILFSEYAINIKEKAMNIKKSSDAS